MGKRSKAEIEPRKEAGNIVKHWLSEISAGKKREKDFRKEGQRILEIYEAQKNPTTPFRIFFSNTESLLPAIYSAVSRPVAQRRFNDADPLGKVFLYHFFGPSS